MIRSIVRTRALGALLVGLAAVLVSACVPEQPAAPSISFNPPGIVYVNRSYTPTATAPNNLPVQFALDASSNACILQDGVLYFANVGNCVVNASQTGDGALPTVQRTLAVKDCPVMRAGVWTGPLGLSANVSVDGTTFSGTVDLSSLGYGVQLFGGLVSCEVVSMTFNNTPLTGILSWDGKVLSSSYNGIDITLYGPA